MASRRLQVRTAVTLLVLGGALLAALPLQWVWWRTARQSSLQLMTVLSEQISSTIRRDLWERVVAAEAAFGVARTLLRSGETAEIAGRALEAALSASNAPSSITFSSTQARRLVATRTADGGVAVTTHDHAQASERPAVAMWRESSEMAGSPGAGVVYTGPVEGGGVLSVAIGFDRFAGFLAAVPAGSSGAAFVVDGAGHVILRPERAGAPPPRVYEAAAAVVAARPRDAVNIIEARRLVVGGAAYRASYSPLEFKDWQLAVLVPEAEFLGEIEQTQRRAVIGLILLALALGLAAAWLGQRILSEPIAALTADVSRIERFQLEDIPYRPGRMQEFDRLSAAIARMATGLADFAKFIPTDLVRTLLADGVRAMPGGESKRLTIMFADVADFTKLSERMGTAVIDILSRYLDVMSRTVEAHGGTIDKFIGDAVMALWGAPRSDDSQAQHACAAALAALDAVREAGIVDDAGSPLRVRIGINSGTAVVGNIGSTTRLNYTAIGDAVNLASRLEGANKVFGTNVLVSEATMLAAEDGFLMREVAEVAVSGKMEAIRVYELLGMRPAGGPPDWVRGYGAALAAYRARRFAKAIALLGQVLQARPDDGPSLWLLRQCELCRAKSPPASWRGVAVLDAK